MDDGVTKIAVIEERLRGMDDALRIRTDEIARRLDDLNHAHEQAVEVQQTYVTVLEYKADRQTAQQTRESAIAANDARHLSMRAEFDERFKRLEGFQSRMLGAFALALLFVPLLTGTLVFLLTK